MSAATREPQATPAWRRRLPERPRARALRAAAVRCRL